MRAGIVFVKGFTSHKTREPSPGEYRLLAAQARELAPDFIGLSVMSSLYLQVAIDLTRILREATGVPVLWGGLHPTLFPEESLEYADFVLRGEGEDALLEFCDHLATGRDWREMPNLCYLEEGTGKARINPLRPLRQDLDGLPFPDLGPGNKYYLAGNQLPARTAGREYCYERSAPAVALTNVPSVATPALRPYRGKGRYLRLRSVENVIAEIKWARKTCPGCVSSVSGTRFSRQRKNGWRSLPADTGKKWVAFEIWGHPNHLQAENIKTGRRRVWKRSSSGFSGSPRSGRNL